MDLTNKYKKILFESSNSSSIVTVKNYLADIRKFVSWYESNFHAPFPPSVLSKETVEAYLGPLAQSSPRSAKRYQSSLRKFFSFMLEEGIITYNPLSIKPDARVQSDPLHLKEFSNFLYTSKLSNTTVKNYVMDVRQFLNWAGSVSNSTNVFAKIDSSLLEEYKTRLLHEAKFSPLSVNRKLSSLRNFLNWAFQKGLLKDNVSVVQEIIKTEKPTNDLPLPPASINDLKSLNTSEISDDTDEIKENPTYSKFSPLRLFQKSKQILGFVLDGLVILSILKGIEAIKYNFWKASGKQIFASLPEVINSFKAGTLVSAPLIKQGVSVADQFVTLGQNTPVGRIRTIPKSVYAPFKISTEALPLYKKLLYHLRYTRPNWYKRYHTYSIVHYLHFGIVLIFATAVGFNIYSIFNNPKGFNAQALASLPESAPRTLSFRGKLTDVNELPITQKSSLRFAIYKDPATMTSKIWEERQVVTPDTEGNFQVTLGQNTTLRQDIFTDNGSLYLGISIGSDAELKPRHQLANVDLTKSAQTLQGLRPITDDATVTSNVILALDSTGNLTIGGSANPVFQATGGELTLSGQQLRLTSNSGSNGNVVIVPDGTGIIDLQKPLQNTSEGNNLDGAQGAVEIDDNLAILATSSAQSALIINQNSTGGLISASSNGSAKFSLDNSGSGSFAGDLSVLGNNLTTVTGTFNIANTNTINLNIGGSATSISIGSTNGTTTVNNNFKVKGAITAESGLIIPKGQAISLVDVAPGTIPFINSSSQIASDSANFFWDQTNKRLGIGTNAPTSKLSIADLAAGAGTTLVIDAAGGIFKNSSSLRYKTDIKPLESDFARILDASPVSFKYKESGALDIGFVAEDFAHLGLNDLVIYNKYGQPDGIKYDKISVYLLEILKLQQKQLNNLSQVTQTVKNGALVVQSISTNTLSIATEDITIGGELLRDYIENIVNEVLDRRLAEKEEDPQVVSPIAQKEIESSPTPTPTPTPDLLPSPTIEPTPTASQPATIVNITNIYNSASISATPTPSMIVPSPTPSVTIPTPTTFQSPTPIPSTVLSPTPSPTSNISTPQTIGQTDTSLIKILANPPTHTINQNIATFSAELSYIPNLKSDFGTFNEGLIALGPTSLTEVSVASQINIGSSMQINDNSINTIASDLSLQPLRQGNLLIMGGLVAIDTQGNLNVLGNANFAKDVRVQGKLAAGIIVPVPDQDLIFQLESPNSNFAIKNSTGSAVLKVGQSGDVDSQGSGRFAQSVESKIGKFANIQIVRGAQADDSLTQTTASSSAGVAVITANETERTIITPFVKADSLIYITPVSDTQGVTPYIARQTIEDSGINSRGSFTVQLPRSVTRDIRLNWWILN